MRPPVLEARCYRSRGCNQRESTRECGLRLLAPLLHRHRRRAVRAGIHPRECPRDKRNDGDEPAAIADKFERPLADYGIGFAALDHRKHARRPATGVASPPFIY